MVMQAASPALAEHWQKLCDGLQQAPAAPDDLGDLSNLRDETWRLRGHLEAVTRCTLARLFKVASINRHLDAALARPIESDGSAAIPSGELQHYVEQTRHVITQALSDPRSPRYLTETTLATLTALVCWRRDIVRFWQSQNQSRAAA
jgi:hypothetical protein